MALEKRCRKIWGDYGIEPKKIDWLVSCLTQEAKDHNDSISDEHILYSKNHLLWYGLSEALLNYVTAEKNF